MKSVFVLITVCVGTKVGLQHGCATRTRDNSCPCIPNSMSHSTLTRSDPFNSNITKIFESKVSPVAQNAWSLVHYATNTSFYALNASRSFEPTWYQNSLHNIVIYLCLSSHTTAYLDRCVSMDSPEAARDKNGDCIIIYDADSCAAQGRCERNYNCKWAPLTENAVSRAPIFNQAEAQAAIDWVTMSYPKTFVAFSMPGFFLAVAVLASATTFFIMRTTCNRCWGRDPCRKGYTSFERWGPMLCFFFFMFLMIILAVLGLAQEQRFKESVDVSLHAINSTLQQLLELKTQVQNPLEAFVQNISKPTIDIKREVSNYWLLLESDVLNATSTYGTSGDFPFYACGQKNHVKSATTANCVVCPAWLCSDVGANLQSMLTQAKISIDSALNTEASIAEILESRTTNVNMAFIMELTATAAEFFHATFEYFHDRAIVFTDVGHAIIILVFALGISSAFMGMIGILAGLFSRRMIFFRLLHLSWISGVFFSALGFAIASAMLVLVVIGHDFCMYFDLVRSNPTHYLPPALATLTTQCLNTSPKRSEWEIFHVQDVMELTCTLDMTLRSTGMVHIAPVSPPQAYLQSIKTRSLELRDYSEAQEKFLLSKLSFVTGRSTWGNNLELPWRAYNIYLDDSHCTSTFSTTQPSIVPLCYMRIRCGGNFTDCYKSFEAAYAYRQGYLEMNVVLKHLQEDLLTRIVPRFNDVIEASRRDSVAIAQAFNQSSVGSLIAKGNKIACAPSMSCDAFKYQLNRLHEAFCQDTLLFLLSSAGALFTASFAHIFVIINVILLHKRLRGELVQIVRQRRVSEKRRQMRNDFVAVAESYLASTDSVQK